MRALMTAIGMLGLMLATGSAHAANLQTFDVSIDRERRLHAKLTRSTDDGAVPSPARHDQFFLPPGMRLDVTAFPFCAPARLSNSVPRRCNRARVGRGTVRFSGITPGAPFRAGTIQIFNARPRGRVPRQLAFVTMSEPAQAAWWFEGKALPAEPPFGAVLDFEEVVLELFGWPVTLVEMDLVVGRTSPRTGRSYVVPPPCPESGELRFMLRSTFLDRQDRPGGPALTTVDTSRCG
jgi:hypothetical protein